MLFATSAAIGLPRDGSHPHRQRGEGRVCSLRKLKSKWKGVGKHTNHNDRDSLPTVAHSIQYSWKCVTFSMQWMALTLEAILSGRADCSFQRRISISQKGNVTARAQFFCHVLCRLRRDGRRSDLVSVPCLRH